MIFSRYRVIQGLSLNFNLFSEIFLELNKCQVKIQKFQGRFYRIFKCLCFKTKKISQLRNNQVQNSISLIIIELRVTGIENYIKIIGATRNCGRWPDMETVKLPEFILGTAIVEKISINVLELLVTLPGCSR